MSLVFPVRRRIIVDPVVEFDASAIPAIGWIPSPSALRASASPLRTPCRMTRRVDVGAIVVGE